MEWVAREAWPRKVNSFLGTLAVSWDHEIEGDHGTEVLWMGSQQERQNRLKSHSDGDYCPRSFVCFPADDLPGFSYMNEEER